MLAINEITERFSTYNAFTHKDLRRYFGSRMTDGTLRSLISYMRARKRLYIIRKGYYTFKKDGICAGFTYEPFYYGLGFAMTCMEIWDQLVPPCVLTTRTVKTNNVRLFGDKDFWAELHHIPMKYFFGYSTVLYDGRQLPVSDPEKTLIDFVYLRKRLAADDYTLLCKSIKRKRLTRYLSKYDSHTTKAAMNIYSRYSKTEESHY